MNSLPSYFTAVGILALLVVVPGPDLAVVSRFALVGGRHSGIRAATGVVAGLAVWGVVTVAGLAAVLAASAEAYTVVRIAGAVYLVAIGIRLLWRGSGGRDATGAGGGLGRPVRTGALTNLFNPKIAVFYATILPTLVPVGGSAAVWLAVLVATHAALSFAWLVLCATALSASSRLAEPAFRRPLDRVTGAVLVSFGLRIAISGR